MSQSDPYQLAGLLKAKARDLGFSRVGIAPAEPSRYRDYFRQWLDDGQAGSMGYLAERFSERTDPATYLPEAVSVICLAVNYYVPLKESHESGQGRIARYALGDDYHDWIKDRLHGLADWLREIAPNAQTRCCTDTAPLMEKDLAAQRRGVGREEHLPDQ